MARPSKASEWLEPDNLILIEGWARDGLTDKDIAEKRIGIGERTFTDWKSRFSAISAALKKGREPIAEKVEQSLYDLCQTQEYTDVITEETQDADGNVTGRKIKTTVRQVPPNPTAIIFALKNLKAYKWKDKPVEAVNVEDTEQIDEMSKSLMQLAEKMESGDNSD